MFDPGLLKSLKIVDWGYSEESRPKSFDKFNDWVEKNDHGSLKYLADHRKDLREDIKNFYPDFQSALVFLFDYSKEKKELDKIYDNENQLKIASYALAFKGEDYHLLLRKSLEEVASKVKSIYPDIELKYTLDIQPVLERDLAYRAGLGFFGKNSMLISRRHGSFFMIGSLLINQKLRLEAKALETDHCGQCTACADSCPTNAIDLETRTLKANQCISTFTIEMFQADAQIPNGYENVQSEIFGCDICQDVCPWNKRIFRKMIDHKTQLDGIQFKLIEDFFLNRPVNEIVEELESWSNKKFLKVFKDTALARTGRKGMLKNLKSLDKF